MFCLSITQFFWSPRTDNSNPDDDTLVESLACHITGMMSCLSLSLCECSRMSVGNTLEYYFC